MKKTVLNRGMLIIMLLAIVGTVNVWAQRPAGQGAAGSPMELRMKRMLPDLTDEQMSQIKTLRIEMLKKVNPLKAQIKEKRAHIETLSLADQADMKAINKSIDELTQLQAQLMKIMAKFRQDVRAILTPDQRAVYDSRVRQMKQKHKGGCHHQAKGKRPGPPPAK